MPSPKPSKPGFLSRGPEIKLPRIAKPGALRRAPKAEQSGATGATDSHSEGRRRPGLPASQSLRLPFRIQGAGALRTARGIVGLDIQPGLAVAAQTQPGNSLQVRQAAAVALDRTAMPEGEVGDEQLLTESLRELFRESGLGKRVRLGIANQRTVFRILELPPLSDRRELAAAVRFQAEDQLPMPISNAVLDFHSLGNFETPDGMRQRVAVVAAQRDIVERLTSAVRAAGLRPEGVDLSAFALIRALYRRGDEEGGQVLYLHIGGITNIAIADGTTCRFTRVTMAGLEAMADRLASRRAIPLEQARALLAAMGAGGSEADALRAGDPASQPEAQNLSRPEGSIAQAPLATQLIGRQHDAPQSQAPVGPAEGGAPAEGGDVAIAIEQGIREIAGEVRNSLEFHSSQLAGPAISEVIVSGPALAFGGFIETLRAELGTKVTARTVPFAPARSHTEGPVNEVDPVKLAIAAGLTCEEAHR